jgi:hypothetical protein
MPPTVRQPRVGVRPDSAGGRGWSAARRLEASKIHREPNGVFSEIGAFIIHNVFFVLNVAFYYSQ